MDDFYDLILELKRSCNNEKLIEKIFNTHYTEILSQEAIYYVSRGYKKFEIKEILYNMYIENDIRDLIDKILDEIKFNE